jgi:hypothetical protein
MTLRESAADGRPALSLRRRSANLIADALEKLSFGGDADLSPEEMMARACRWTGQSDWGDEAFQTPMRILTESLRKQPRLNNLGRRLIVSFIQFPLAKRLKILAELKDNPTILDVPIRRPLFILGLPRTGTTLLHNLLAQDPACRVLQYWELMNPAPPPSYASYAVDPRIEQARRTLRTHDWFAPAFKKIHDCEAQSPEECRFLFHNSFGCQAFAMQLDLPEYEEWLNGTDAIELYRFYKKQLQLLTWRCSAQHLALKCTTHLWRLPALLSVLPDANIICTHRNPASVVPSFCSLNAHFRLMFSDDVDLSAVGAQTTRALVEGVTRAMRARESLDPARFVDVQFASVMKDPVGTVRGIYDRFGYTFSSTMEKNIRKWLAENPQHRHGKHSYSLETFGLDPAVVKRQFSEYCERFAVPT